MNIAVFFHRASGGLRPFFDCDALDIYERTSPGWRVLRSLPLNFPREGMREMRARLRALADEIRDCPAVAGAKLSGLPYAALDSAGYAIFSIDSVSDAVLDGIAADLDAAADAPQAPAYAPQPSGAPGEFSLDLAALQRERPEVTSKMAMKSFIDGGAFTKLTLICRHVPPWIELDERLAFDAEMDGDLFRAEIWKA
ncbi:MAG: hypothetical protein LBD92_07590 [Oscillospiraceae bacterium]|nr:hypothetical protein [Oscillospiraceae bacterium]